MNRQPIVPEEGVYYYQTIFALILYKQLSLRKTKYLLTCTSLYRRKDKFVLCNFYASIKVLMFRNVMPWSNNSHWRIFAKWYGHLNMEGEFTPNTHLNVQCGSAQIHTTFSLIPLKYFWNRHILFKWILYWYKTLFYFATHRTMSNLIWMKMVSRSLSSWW